MEPKMKIFPIHSDDKRVERVCSILDGLTQSGANAVIFRNEPEVWFQFYLGLYLGKPTFVIIQKKDNTGITAFQLKVPNVHITEVDEFNDKALEDFAGNLAKGVNR